MSIANNIARLKSELSPGNVCLVAVSKKQPIEKIQEALNAGQIDFGENYVQELLVKNDLLPHKIKWHMIGHLQTNKVKFIVPFVHLIQSVDSLKLLKEINKEGKKINKVINCLLQVHIAQEETKTGFEATELLKLFEENLLSSLSNIKILGFMGMASFTSDDQIIREEFKYLKNLQSQLLTFANDRNLILDQLSMGMSSDWKLAVECGSTIIRVGSSIFGERK